ncbi:hypothetical protein AVDCRST_MAG81-671 [uncultured Synechococcales cyanobacterium]|uniref:Uncharacterized protein n=1 Tax=uncultured Synechococcales cyanobacterium TaxID=1936017 RepID=A0A6J4UXG6_9CYAN|nr:hypothetical protein AVDCRST_MAG81-671 [uncultured Synechococcales cyanobacterium]
MGSENLIEEALGVETWQDYQELFLLPSMCFHHWLPKGIVKLSSREGDY